MKIFKELNKLGYKHYTEHTVEELDDLPLDSEERIMEQAMVLRWFREKYNCHHTIHQNKKYVGIAYSSVVNFSIDEFDTYEEAELACLIKLIEIIKNK